MNRMVEQRSTVMHLTQASLFISPWFTIVEPPGWRNAREQQPRRIRLSPEARHAIERQLAAFREKFGRDPSDDDPIFFDPDANDPVPLSDEKYERMMIEAMAEVGISQAMIFAFSLNFQLRHKQHGDSGV